MSTSTMHFGPEWMRTKQPAPRMQADPTPPPPASAPATYASTYSALVSSAPPPLSDSRDEAHPFRYSKEVLLQIFRDGGGQGGLGLEVERWEGVVREIGTEPTSLREMGEAEKKLFSVSLNSDLRRRQSTDYLPTSSGQNSGAERPRLTHVNSATGAASPLRERFGSLAGRRRGDSIGDQISIPRKLSLSSMQSPMSPRDTGLPSPRPSRMGAGFDGVLNGGDSWVARRRASEGLAKSGGGTTRDPGGEYQPDGRSSEIKEEDESPSQAMDSDPHPDGLHPHSAGDETTAAAGTSRSPTQNLDASVTQMSLGNDNGHSSSASPANSSAGYPPPGLTDVSNVEWSYLDPQGQIQGPFRASVMQKWHDEGYFTADLLMRRTHLDTDWMSVGELIRRVGGPQIFLTPIIPALPPGLSRHVDSPQHMYAISQDQFNVPFQPAPIRSLRSSTLDSYLGSSNLSESPTSSLGAGRYSNGSPDPSAFGGHAGNFISPDPGRRNNFADGGMDHRSYGQFTPNRTSTVDNTYLVNGSFSSSPWLSSTGNAVAISSGFDSGRASVELPSSFHNNGLGSSLPGGFGPVASQDNLHTTNAFGGGTDFRSLDPVPDASPPPTFNSYNAFPNQTFVLQPSESIATRIPQQPIPDNSSTTPVSPWGNIQDVPASAPRRSGPFDSNHPPSTNASLLEQTVNPSPWGTSGSLPRAGLSKTIEPSPWPAPVQPATENRKEDIFVSRSLSKDDFRQNNKSSDIESAVPQTIAQSPEPAPAEMQADSLHVSSVRKSRGSKASVPSKQNIIQPAPRPPSPIASPPIPIHKPAWVKDDDAGKLSGVSLSLREIQEVEARQADARKAAERERARAAASASAANDEIQPFVTSWGLPTSQAGSRTSNAQIKETTSTSAPVPTVVQPVWMTTAKVPTTKKTMKEIQEEEEKRRKMAAKETAASVASRRAYAETTVKSPVTLGGGAWTTVGPSGKSAPPPAAPVRTPVPSAASSAAVPRANGSPTAIRPAPTPAPKPATGGKMGDYPVAPSHEFLKWLNESLKGLNSSVNVEEIMQMLLSFSMDPDPSTVELISDLIYSNSTILDGRRFASEFVSKRKADAAARKGTASSAAGMTKPVSIAEVVKAQPKPQASEWGGFKVVNKKKKGGRS
ncbi:uncharacterized protein BT62DRAFT_961749 [Guyanagaster necrorhizus]|uniref:GYF domain-containing protein n=1 Tax=Guyanagaster necrorhizus TaxID=856835 RepID=A0A9P7VYW2_9AGAR|nr:uncharacterized protein BT62DRAFT_961749 [Guyanagaster necrorhizus MCA 3950]KAG7450136.1 hypothetical protein BT62DRAFT_961749 [Guyanagaster necrorhizus MCA 3950]